MILITIYTHTPLIKNPQPPLPPELPPQKFMNKPICPLSPPTRAIYSKFLFIYLYSMQRKNSEARFHTAGARIVNSTKLPPDFFKPQPEKGVHFRLHRSQPHQKPYLTHNRTVSAVDTLFVTFHRSASQNKLEPPLRYSCGDERRSRKGMLPPVCHPCCPIEK